jgi:UDP-N-acetyl-D-glucosamine dehydrogenase
LEVIAVDVDHAKLASIAAGESYVEDVSSKRLGSVSERITATPRYAKLTKADAIVVCVPTPLTANREPDLGVLRDAGLAIAGVLQEDQLIVLESTTYPGTTRERLVPLLEESGMRAGHDFHVAYSPERVDPGRTDFTMRTTPKVVGGLTPACGDRAEELYAHVCDDVVRVSSPDVAELTKLLENIFRSVNIALVNELTLLCDRMGIDNWEVVDAAATNPYGFMRFDPGQAWVVIASPRPVLSVLARARVRYGDGVHRAGRKDQPGHAVQMRRARGARAQRPGEGRPRRARRNPGHQLQARCRRRSRRR